ncbi:LCP family protein [Krasilnikoviella flava]|uniref:Transcriptional attenuator, LytR family n=1 Tax=Krasilnikoviella flava TaxID=526729 RepID=A0A1T5JPA8_9MICO|nr:LCP family protein [Krasilnikoviella flava]SKC53241.1 transcriptional attenuator, LytR family [Krasilnikoviella flava]
MRTLPRHASSLASHRVVRSIALVVTAVVAFVSAAAVASFVDLRSQIAVSDVDDLLADDDRPPEVAAEQDPSDPFAGKDLNILVMGTDFRDEANAEIAGAGDEFHSDTTLLVHLSGDRSRIEAVSIPRDSLVDIPACKLPGGGETSPQSDAMFNSSFTLGGGADKDVTGAAACTIRTVEELTGVRISDHVVVQMTGVIGVVDAIGGVTMCLPEPVKGERVDLDLPEGKQKLDGYTAINFLRARKGEGMGLEIGSDLKRIERQQAFFDAAMREILSQNVITDSPRLYRMVREILGSISTDPELASPTALAGLAWSIRDIDPSRIVFTSVPVATAPSDPNRVVWTSEADAIWERIRADEAPPGTPEPDRDASRRPSGATAVDDDVASPDSDEPGATGTSGSGEGKGDVAGEDGGTRGGKEGDGGSPDPSPSPSVLPGVCA